MPAATAPRHILMGPVYGAGGYGTGLRGLAAACGAAGLGMRLEETVWSSWDAGIGDGQRQALDDAFHAPMQPGEAYARVWHFLPYYYRPDGTARRTIGRATCDTDRLSEAFVDGCDRVDEVWVPNRFSYETFANSGIAPARLRLLPTCVDAARIRAADPIEPGTGRGFNFLAVGEWAPRNGWDILVRAFVREFKPDEDVGLVIKTHSLDVSLEQVAASVSQVAQRETGGRPVAPIRLLVGVVPEAAIHGLMRSCQAYVQPSHGEGWGHSLMEAMAAGLPAIATRWGGHLDVMNDANSYLLDYQLVPVPPDAWSSHPSYPGHRWAEPSVEHLQVLMRSVFRDRAQASNRAAKAQQDVEFGSSPAVVGRLLRELCEAQD